MSDIALNRGLVASGRTATPCDIGEARSREAFLHAALGQRAT